MIVALVDAGPLIALFDTQDTFHTRFRKMLTQPEIPLRLHTTWPCVTEASHMLGARERVGLLRWIGAQGAQIFPFDSEDLPDMSEWMSRYTSERAEMDFADASLYWVAAQTGINRIMTLDVRDFSRYRLPDGQAFEIL